MKQKEQPTLSNLLNAHLESSKLKGMGFRQFCTTILKIRLTRQQYKIARLVEERHRKIAIGSGHGVGKTYLGAVLFCWGLACWLPEPVIITSAPTRRQVSQIWREIRRLWNGTPCLKEIAECKFESLEISPMHYGMGFSTNQPGRFQGIHSANLFFIIDEGNYFSNDIWIAIDACCTGTQSIVYTIGNCVKPTGVFFKAFSSKSWKTMRVSSRKHPNVRANKELIRGAVTKEWIDNFEVEYPNPSIIGARIDAIFPEGSSNTLITRKSFRKSINRITKTSWPSVLSVNPSKYADSNTTMCIMNGQELKEIIELTDNNLLPVCQKILELTQNNKIDYIVIDDDAIANKITETLPGSLPIVSFHSSGNANIDKRYSNQMSEAYALTKAVICEGLLSVSDQLKQLKTLEIQLTNRNYEIVDSSDGQKLKIENSKDYKERMALPSPDISDAMVMATYIVALDWSRNA